MNRSSNVILELITNIISFIVTAIEGAAHAIGTLFGGRADAPEASPTKDKPQDTPDIETDQKPEQENPEQQQDIDKTFEQNLQRCIQDIAPGKQVELMQFSTCPKPEQKLFKAGFSLSKDELSKGYIIAITDPYHKATPPTYAFVSRDTSTIRVLNNDASQIPIPYSMKAMTPPDALIASAIGSIYQLPTLETLQDKLEYKSGKMEFDGLLSAKVQKTDDGNYRITLAGNQHTDSSILEHAQSFSSPAQATIFIRDALRKAIEANDKASDEVKTKILHDYVDARVNFRRQEHPIHIAPNYTGENDYETQRIINTIHNEIEKGNLTIPQMIQAMHIDDAIKEVESERPPYTLQFGTLSIKVDYNEDQPIGQQYRYTIANNRPGRADEGLIISACPYVDAIALRQIAELGLENLYKAKPYITTKDNPHPDVDPFFTNDLNKQFHAITEQARARQPMPISPAHESIQSMLGFATALKGRVVVMDGVLEAQSNDVGNIQLTLRSSTDNSVISTIYADNALTAQAILETIALQNSHATADPVQPTYYNFSQAVNVLGLDDHIITSDQYKEYYVENDAPPVQLYQPGNEPMPDNEPLPEGTSSPDALPIETIRQELATQIQKETNIGLQNEGVCEIMGINDEVGSTFTANDPAKQQLINQKLYEIIASDPLKYGQQTAYNTIYPAQELAHHIMNPRTTYMDSQVMGTAILLQNNQITLNGVTYDRDRISEPTMALLINNVAYCNMRNEAIYLPAPAEVYEADTRTQSVMETADTVMQSTACYKQTALPFSNVYLSKNEENQLCLINTSYQPPIVIVPENEQQLQQIGTLLTLQGAHTFEYMAIAMNLPNMAETYYQSSQAYEINGWISEATMTGHEVSQMTDKGEVAVSYNSETGAYAVSLNNIRYECQNAEIAGATINEWMNADAPQVSEQYVDVVPDIPETENPYTHIDEMLNIGDGDNTSFYLDDNYSSTVYVTNNGGLYDVTIEGMSKRGGWQTLEFTCDRETATELISAYEQGEDISSHIDNLPDPYAEFAETPDVI